MPLLAHLPYGCTFVEPCAANGQLIDWLEEAGHSCVFACDIEPERADVHAMSALSIRYIAADYFITNPPWTREALHPIIFHLSDLKPTWLLIDADWMHNVTAPVPMLVDRCVMVIPIGRLKWIPGSANSGKDNCIWALFDHRHAGGPRFMPRMKVDR